MVDRNKLVARWRTALTRGVGHDSWGQLVEAGEEYQKLARQLQQEATREATLFNNTQKENLRKVAVCLNLRSKSLLSPDTSQTLSLEELKRVDTVLEKLLSSAQSEFPVDIPAEAALFRPATQKGNFELDLDGDEIDNEDEEDQGSQQKSATTSPGIKPMGSLLPMIPHEKGTTNLVVSVDKIGLKAASSYLDPFIVVSLKDNKGIDVTAAQLTPVATKREDPYILFGVDVHLQKPLERLPKGTAIFFEFRHYKAKKRSISTKCFAFMEMDEIKPGPVVIELYQKPTDFKRKKLALLWSVDLHVVIRQANASSQRQRQQQQSHSQGEADSPVSL